MYVMLEQEAKEASLPLHRPKRLPKRDEAWPQISGPCTLRLPMAAPPPQP